MKRGVPMNRPTFAELVPSAPGIVNAPHVLMVIACIAAGIALAVAIAALVRVPGTAATFTTTALVSQTLDVAGDAVFEGALSGAPSDRGVGAAPVLIASGLDVDAGLNVRGNVELIGTAPAITATTVANGPPAPLIVGAADALVYIPGSLVGGMPGTGSVSSALLSVACGLAVTGSTYFSGPVAGGVEGTTEPLELPSGLNTSGHIVLVGSGATISAVGSNGAPAPVSIAGDLVVTGALTCASFAGQSASGATGATGARSFLTRAGSWVTSWAPKMSPTIWRAEPSGSCAA